MDVITYPWVITISLRPGPKEISGSYAVTSIMDWCIMFSDVPAQMFNYNYCKFWYFVSRYQLSNLYSSNVTKVQLLEIWQYCLLSLPTQYKNLMWDFPSKTKTIMLINLQIDSFLWNFCTWPTRSVDAIHCCWDDKINLFDKHDRICKTFDGLV